MLGVDANVNKKTYGTHTNAWCLQATTSRERGVVMGTETVAVIGSDARTHALCWILAQSPNVKKVFAIPGNPGTKPIAENIANIDPCDGEGLVRFVKANRVGLTVVGPEAPLFAGVVDHFHRAGIHSIVGPRHRAAYLEESKKDAKDVLERANIATPPFQVFENYERALRYVKQRGLPIVVKANGPCQGKGVRVCHTLAQAQDALNSMLVRHVFGQAGRTVLVEDFVLGREVSVQVLCDGNSYEILPFVQDHKRLLDNNKGPNTGGMGAYSPVLWVTDALSARITDTIVDPLFSALQREGRPFTGCLYPGIMVGADGKPMVLEINARFGDPEWPTLAVQLASDGFDFFDQCARGILGSREIVWRAGAAVCVVLAGAGYAEQRISKKQSIIYGLRDAEALPGVEVFHASTVARGGNVYALAGRRVLSIVARGSTLREARQRAYEAVACIDFEGMLFRRDIALDAIAA